MVLRVNGSVPMRRAVVKQMKKPMEKRTTRPTREPRDMLRRTMTGIGRTKIAMSVMRFVIALDQLRRQSALVIHTSGVVLTGVQRS